MRERELRVGDLVRFMETPEGAMGFFTIGDFGFISRVEEDGVFVRREKEHIGAFFVNPKILEIVE